MEEIPTGNAVAKQEGTPLTVEAALQSLEPLLFHLSGHRGKEGIFINGDDVSVYEAAFIQLRENIKGRSHMDLYHFSIEKDGDDLLATITRSE